MVTVLRTVDAVLSWAGLLVDPPLRAAVRRLPEPLRDVAELQFGWHDDGAGAAGANRAPLRCALTLVCADAVGGDPHDAVPAAVAVELLHHWAQIRRDLVDGDCWAGSPPGELTRRGRPTAWSVFGAQPAALCGEALLALAFDVVATGEPGRTAHGPVRQSTGPAGRGGTATVRVLGDTVQQLLHGQHASLARHDTPTLAPPAAATRADVLRECLATAERRTGALFGCACALGAVAAGGDAARVEQMRLFGVRLGLAVQFAEDLTGIWGHPAETGRSSYPDLRRRRRTLPVAAALAAGVDEVSVLLGRAGPLSDADVEQAAKTIEQSGARDWCRQQADDLLAQALLALDLAIPSPSAVAELVALARRAVA